MIYDLKEEGGWMPDFDALEKMDLSGVKLMWTNYPHMPTGAAATPELYRKIVDFALRHRILVVNDNPYSFILTEKPISIFSADGATDCCLELNSLSKAHNMSGWRIGMVAGASDLIAEVLKVKSQMDSGMFKPLQLAAVEALGQGPEWFAALNEEYRRRKAAAGKIMDKIGAKYSSNSAGLFLWGRISPDNQYLGGTDETKSLGERVSDKLLYEAGVFITPGMVFGKNGADYIRISLRANVDVYGTVLEKIGRISL
jgi:aspartate/methionine/tyrosine aminotransferase